MTFQVLLKHSHSLGIRLGGPPVPAGDTTTTVIPPLVSAIIVPRPEIVELIVAHRPPIELDEVCVNCGDDWTPGSMTPLMLSMHYDHPEITLLLLDAVARLDLSIVDNEGWTALHHAAKRGSARPVRRLLNAGIDKNIKTNDGETAADLARRANVKLLIDEFTVPDTGNVKDPKEMLKKKKAAAQKKKGDVKKKSAKKSTK